MAAPAVGLAVDPIEERRDEFARTRVKKIVVEIEVKVIFDREQDFDTVDVVEAVRSLDKTVASAARADFMFDKI